MTANFDKQLWTVWRRDLPWLSRPKSTRVLQVWSTKQQITLKHCCDAFVFLLYFLTFAVLDLVKGITSIFCRTCFLTIYWVGLKNMKGLCRHICGVSAETSGANLAMWRGEGRVHLIPFKERFPGVFLYSVIQNFQWISHWSARVLYQWSHKIRPSASSGTRLIHSCRIFIGSPFLAKNPFSCPFRAYTKLTGTSKIPMDNIYTCPRG